MKWEQHIEDDEYNLYGDDGQYYGFLWKSKIYRNWCFKLSDKQTGHGAILKATALEEAMEQAIAFTVENRLD